MQYRTALRILITLLLFRGHWKYEQTTENSLLLFTNKPVEAEGEFWDKSNVILQITGHLS